MPQHDRGNKARRASERARANFFRAMPSPQGKRFRPSVAALASVRQYKRPAPQADFASRVADVAAAGSSGGGNAGRRRGGTGVMSERARAHAADASS